MGGDTANDFVNAPMHSLTLGQAKKEEEKTKRTEMELNAQKDRESAAAAKAAADAEAAKIAKQKEDEEALVRRNLLTAAVKQRLTGRTYSATRLSAGEA